MHCVFGRQLTCWVRNLGLACLTGVLLILSFPKFDLSILAWVGLVPLLVAIEGKSLKQAFFLSYVTGLVFTAGIFHWIWSVRAFNLIDYALLGVVFLPQYVSLWGLGLNWIRKRTGLSAALVAAPLWVTLEYVRSNLSFLSAPWMLLGHSLYQHPSLIQITSLTGVYGLSFLIVLTNAAIVEVIFSVRPRLSEPATSSPFRRFPLRSLIVAGFLLGGTYLYGLFVLSRGIEGERMTVALVQGNIPQEVKWDQSYRQMILERHSRLTLNAAQKTPSLIIWPETAVPGDVQHDPELRQKVTQVAINTKSYLLVGSAEHAKFTDRKLRGKYYNNMYLLSPEGKIEGQYRKIALVPFGEYEPLRGYIKWPEAIASPVSNTLSGDQYTLFTLGTAKFGVTICWENIFPDLFREFVKRGARLMVNATNEAWFGDSAEPYQHLVMSVFRAAENRVAIARAANTGISALIDPFGRIVERLQGPDQKDLFVEGVLVGRIPLSREKTFYTRYGDLFAFLQIAVAVLFLFFPIARTRTRQEDPSSSMR